MKKNFMLALLLVLLSFSLASCGSAEETEATEEVKLEIQDQGEDCDEDEDGGCKVEFDEGLIEDESETEAGEEEATEGEGEPVEIEVTETPIVEGQNLDNASEDTESMIIDEENNRTVTTSPAGDVVIYTKPGCPTCEALLTFLDKYKVAYTEKNIDENEEIKAEFEERGFTTVPSMLVGETEIPGYDPDAIREALGIKVYNEDGNLLDVGNN